MSVHLHELVHGPQPKPTTVSLIPDINLDASQHVVASHVADHLSQELIPQCPASIVSGEWIRGGLRSVRTPQVMQENYELSSN